MINAYLRPIGDETKFSDAANYVEMPTNPPDGFEWVAGSPPDAAIPYVEKTLADKLEALFLSSLQQLGGVLSAAERGQLFLLKAGVMEALKFDAEAAKALIETATLPQGDQVEAARTALLAEFP